MRLSVKPRDNHAFIEHVLASFGRERERHTEHLRTIEADLDAQVAKVQSEAREQAKRDHDEEKRQLEIKMEQEMMQMQSQLKIFQKVGGNKKFFCHVT